jgi:hypothetical protein
MEEEGYGRVSAHLFHAQFGFKLSSIFMDQEIISKSRLLQETIFMFWFRASKGYLWLLPFVCYKIHGLIIRMMATSTGILAPQSYALTSELPFMQFVKIKCLNNRHVVQQESLLSLSSSNSFHSITEFCSESEDATPIDCQPNSMHIDLC